MNPPKKRSQPLKEISHWTNNSTQTDTSHGPISVALASHSKELLNLTRTSSQSPPKELIRGYLEFFFERLKFKRSTLTLKPMISKSEDLPDVRQHSLWMKVRGLVFSNHLTSQFYWILSTKEGILRGAAPSEFLSNWRVFSRGEGGKDGNYGSEISESLQAGLAPCDGAGK